MRVLGFTDEVTVCDCCGKSNLSGTFGIEADDGAELHYGSVCMNRVFGKKRGDAIKSAARRVASVQSGSWEEALGKLALGHFGGDIMGLTDIGKPIWNNSNDMLRAVTAIARFNGKSFDVIRERD